MDKLHTYSQQELKYIFESSEARMAEHPDYTNEQKAIVQKQLSFNTEEEAINMAMDMKKRGFFDCQVWAKIGRDEEYFYIDKYYISTDDNVVKKAAEYIGMAHIFTS